MVKLLVINYGAGNLQSIKYGFEKLGAEVIVEQPPFSNLNSYDGIILPGVGAFAAAMNRLDGYQDQLIDTIEQGKPLLGICLGLQLLYSLGYEVKPTKGLNLLSGSIRELETIEKLPQIGWNTVQIVQENPILEGISNESYFYFVNSYIACPTFGNEVIAITDYGIKFPSVIAANNVFATQFHPEKSSENGMRILQNFLNIIRR